MSTQDTPAAPQPQQQGALADTELDKATGGTLDTMQMSIQMAMDRRSKALEMASNILKSSSDTSSTIVGNLK